MTATTDMIDTGVPITKIERLRVAGPTSLEVVWSVGSRMGRCDVVDVAPALATYKFYRPLRMDAALFATARLIDGGAAIEWGDGELDMTAEMVEMLADEAMSAEEFRAFLKRNRLTQEAAAAVLGRSRRQIANYATHGAIPRVVALACHGYEALEARKKRAA